MMQQMLAVWSLAPLPFLKPAWTSGSSRFTCCWSLAWRILSIIFLACEMSAAVRHLNSSAEAFSRPGANTALLQARGHTERSALAAASAGLKQLSCPPLRRLCPVRLPEAACLGIPGCLAPGEWSHRHGYLGHNKKCLSVYIPVRRQLTF